jgi:hypothetical protein
MSTVAKLPVTVESVTRRPGAMWAVTVAFADFTTGVYVVPDSLASVEAVRISALAMAQLLDVVPPQQSAPHHKHRRYSPRP